MKFGTLWFGNKPTILQKISWSSYLHHGHQLFIYVYDKNIDLPKGAIKMDANEIIDESKIFLPKVGYGGGHSQFSDYFRIRMLKNTDLIWTDSDIVCLKNEWPDKEPCLFGKQIATPNGEGSLNINNDILYISQPEVLEDILERQKLIPDNFEQETMMGPNLLTEIIEKHGLMNYAKPEQMFHSIRWANVDYFIREDKTKEALELIADNPAVSLYHSSWTGHNLISLLESPISTNTVLGKFIEKYL